MADVSLAERFIANAQSAAARLHVRSALNPMLWLCGIISLPCFAGAYWTRGVEPLSTILTCVGVAPIGATIIGFFYFMVIAPDKLQSEEYQIRHEALELVKEKGSSVALSASALEKITNPIRSLPRGGDR